MRFIVAAAVLATSAIAQYAPPSYEESGAAPEAPTATYEPPAVSTDYITKVHTITSASGVAVTTSVVPLTTSVVYTTKVHTITSCAPEVTNCPAHSTVYSTETVPAYTTVCPVTEATPSATYGWGNGTSVVPPYVAPTAPGSQSSPGPYSPPAAAPTSVYVVPSGSPASPSVCTGSSTVTAITKSYTTVLTSVEYQTISVPCPTGGAPAPSGTGVPPYAPPAGNGPAQPPVPGAAASFTASAVLAAVAGVAALILA
jgi:hypothetical protein